jgi:hypothetical protein
VIQQQSRHAVLPLLLLPLPSLCLKQERIATWLWLPLQAFEETQGKLDEELVSRTATASTR